MRSQEENEGGRAGEREGKGEAKKIAYIGGGGGRDESSGGNVAGKINAEGNSVHRLAEKCRGLKRMSWPVDNSPFSK